MLSEIVEVEAYKSDYKEITAYFQNKPLEYEEAISVIGRVIDSGIF